MNLATWPVRVGAFIVDYIPAWLLFGIGAGVGRNDDGTLGPIYFVFSLLGFGYIVYNRWILGGKGQSLGKKALGLYLVKEQTGQPIGAGMAFLRDIAHIVDSIICYIGWLFPLWDAKKQTLGDKIVGTVVTKA
ncbi:RDD family protein [Dactylosporangium sp. NPDC050588]|uniref:RDD family protein n=1 Tax=Dactylosporangium sp. NPDC050588 TaxID=3157211 RepID=UPI0033FD9AA0